MDRLGSTTNNGVSLAFRTIAASTTTNGAAVDTNGYNGAELNVFCGQFGAAGATLDCKVQESDDNSNWSDVTGAAITQVNQAAGADKLITVDVRLANANRKRYLRAVSVTGATNTVAHGAFFKLYGAKNQPTTQSPAAVLA